MAVGDCNTTCRGKGEVFGVDYRCIEFARKGDKFFEKQHREKKVERTSTRYYNIVSSVYVCDSIVRDYYVKLLTSVKNREN